MEDPIDITLDELDASLLEPLLGIHSAPTDAWLADSAANAAERALGALYCVLYVSDAYGRLVAVTPASTPQKASRARLTQVLGVDLPGQKLNPEDRPELSQALADGRAISVSDLSEVFAVALAKKAAKSAQRQLGVTSAVAAPLYWNGESSGLLVLLAGTPITGQLAAAELLGRHIAVALANLREKEASRKHGEVDAVRWVYDERRLMDELGQESRRAKRHDRPLSVLVVRILNLDELQTRYGRFLAERVLRQVAGRLDDAMRDTDFLGASGSDGFGAILVEANADGAHIAEERLLAGLQEMKLPHTDLPNLEIRIGCATATLPQDGEAAEELTAAAEARLQERIITQQDAASA